MTATIPTWHRNDEMLNRLGFPEVDEFGLAAIAHPGNDKVTLVSSQRVPDRLDLFTQFGSGPLNTPGDPLNICIGIPDHDKALAEAITKTVIDHFLSLSV